MSGVGEGWVEKQVKLSVLYYSYICHKNDSLLKRHSIKNSHLNYPLYKTCKFAPQYLPVKLTWSFAWSFLII